MIILINMGLSSQQLIKKVSLYRDTDAAVISALQGARRHNPTSIESAVKALDRVVDEIA
jgi:hypothetical protein